MSTLKLPRPPLAPQQSALFLDLDGTLMGFADTPEQARPADSTHELLGALHRGANGALALVSGRMLADLHARFGTLHLPMAGLHGLERRDASGRLWIHAAPPATKHQIIESLAPVLQRHPGLLLEDKGLTLALHYRRTPALSSYVHRLMTAIAGDEHNGLELQRGKCVVELKPAGINKGSAIAEYMQEHPFRGRLPIFVGDDLNDEPGFEAVNRLNGLSIKVGTGKTLARYRLPDVASVHRWLNASLETWT